MRARAPSISARAIELRRGFDESFTRPAEGGDVPTVDLLGVRVGGTPYALRASDVTALVADARVTPLPGARRELVGLAAVRGVVAPVYSLSALLGHGGEGSPRWILLLDHAHPVALAFDEFDGHHRVDAAAVALDAARPDGVQAHVRGVVRTREGAARGLVDAGSIVAALARRFLPPDPPEERTDDS